LAEKRKQVEVIAFQEQAQKEAVEYEPQAIEIIGDEPIEFYSEDEISIENEDVEITESQNELNDQQYFEQILPDNYKATAIDSPMVKTKEVVPKAYNTEWRDSAAKWGFILTVLWIVGFIAWVLAVGSLGPNWGTLVTIFVFGTLLLIILAFLAGLVLSIIGLGSENNRIIAFISTGIYGLILIPILISALINLSGN